MSQHLLGKTVLFGTATAALYALIFTHAEQFTRTCADGGFCTAVPLMTVLLVSYLHGSFASNLWSLLGITAQNKPGASKPQEDETRPLPQCNTPAHA